jgi:hypothetical protein
VALGLLGGRRSGAVYSSAGGVDGSVEPLRGRDRVRDQHLEGTFCELLGRWVITPAPVHGCGLEHIDAEILYGLSLKLALTAGVVVEVLDDVASVFGGGIARSNTSISRSRRSRSASPMSWRLSSVAIISAQRRRARNDRRAVVRRSVAHDLGSSSRQRRTTRPTEVPTTIGKPRSRRAREPATTGGLRCCSQVQDRATRLIEQQLTTLSIARRLAVHGAWRSCTASPATRPHRPAGLERSGYLAPGFGVRTSVRCCCSLASREGQQRR